jgi:hypothetical protein
MKTSYSLTLTILALSLTACSAIDTIGGPTVHNFKPPVIDEATMTPSQKAEYPTQLAQCQTLANSAITEFEERAALYSDNEQTRVTEKRRAVRRACLQQRGYQILY